MGKLAEYEAKAKEFDAALAFIHHLGNSQWGYSKHDKMVLEAAERGEGLFHKAFMDAITESMPQIIADTRAGLNVGMQEAANAARDEALELIERTTECQ